MPVLPVEDTNPLRLMFDRGPELQGFEVREAVDGRQALGVLRGYSPELTLADLMMPVLGGIEPIRRVRAMPALAGVPVVAMTAQATAEAERQARDAGASDFIEKPVEIPTLLGWLHGLRADDPAGARSPR